MENVGVDQKVSCTGLAEDWGREAHSMGLAGFLTADWGRPSPTVVAVTEGRVFTPQICLGGKQVGVSVV